MKRRVMLEQLAAAAVLPFAAGVAPGRSPSAVQWETLRDALGGRLLRLEPAFAACTSAAACDALFADLKNPYYINEHPNVTQTLGWADAWKTEVGPYAVAAASAADVALAVNFAREHGVRLAVRGGAHSYQGTSNAPGSLLIWTRQMNAIVMHDAFVPQGCTSAPVAAVSVGSGNIWAHVYDAVTTQRGRYVQGGGCATVGVAGLISSGGFGSFSKRFGVAAAGLLEAEVVTADGEIRIANACENADLFWALKGGGGGSFGVITRLTLRTHELPETFGAVLGTVKANSDEAFRRLIERFVSLYAEQLNDQHWGEQVAFTPANTLELGLVSQGLNETQSEALWQPFFAWIAASPHDYSWIKKPQIITMPARHWWDPAYLEAHYPWSIVRDTRAGAAPGNFWWVGNVGETGQFLHEYDSLWMPASLLEPVNRARLTASLLAASRQWRISLHCNKGLSSASHEVRDDALQTAINPAAVGAFALAIASSSSDGVYPGVPGHLPEMAQERARATRVRAAMSALRSVAPNGGSYVSEASYFATSWKRDYWGPHYARLAAIKQSYDPHGLFTVHHGVGSE